MLKDPSVPTPTSHAEGLHPEATPYALAVLNPADFSSSEARHNLLSNMTPVGYTRWVVGLNAVNRGLSPEEGEVAQGLTVVGVAASEGSIGGAASFYCSPSTEVLKGVVLARSFNAAARMDDDRAIGTLLGLANTIAHVNDGTGRTSRELYSLFAEGYDGSQHAQQRLARLLKEGNRSLIDMNPERANLPIGFAAHDTAILAHDLGFSLDESQALTLHNLPPASLETEVDAQSLSAVLVNEPSFNMPTILEWAKQSNRGIRSFMDEQGRVDGGKVAKAMAETGSINMLNVRDVVNMRYAATIVDCLAEGDESVYGPDARRRILEAYDPKTASQMALGYLSVSNV